MCKYCRVSVPEINGQLTRHREHCEWRKIKEGELALASLQKKQKLNGAVQVWGFKDAPVEFKEMSTKGRDRDFVVLADAEHDEDKVLDIVEKLVIDDYEKHQTFIKGRKMFVYICM